MLWDVIVWKFITSFTINPLITSNGWFQAIADVIRTCLGPQAMLKMLMDPMGGIVMTNDGNAILREITVQHPAGKSIIEIARTQDEEVQIRHSLYRTYQFFVDKLIVAVCYSWQVGDGTTSVIVLAGEMLAVGEQFLEEQMHPTVIIGAYRQALEDMVSVLEEKIRWLRISVCSLNVRITFVIRTQVDVLFQR